MPDKPQENFEAVAKNKFDLDGLRAALKADNPDEIRTVAWKYFTALLVLEDAKKVAEEYGVAKGTVYTELNREIKPDLLRILQLPEKRRIIWGHVSDWLLEAGYGKNQEPISIDWQQVCREVLKNQNQWLITHALGSGHRRVSDMYVPLELVERKQPLRLDPNIPPEKGSEYYQEKRTPIKHEDFFEAVLKQGMSLESNGRRIAIIGEPGAGKTTLLQGIASRVEGLPIWIDLAELNPQVEDCLENYLLQKWLDKKASSVIRRLLPEVVLSQEELKKAFKEAFYQNPVWLLLDGANEIPANLSNPLTWIDKQIREGWISEARVVLTCRLNVGDIHNDLPGFDIYCNRDFSYPEQVEEFINKWFVKKAEQESRENLKAELRRANERIQNLIKNPLRLMLLCRTWEDGVKLQDITKAGFYQRLVKGFYKLKDRDNNPKFKIDRNRQEELNRKLGKLALQAIDGKDARFRLRESSIEELLGYPDQEDSLFWIARELGWLNQVGLPMLEEKDSDENVYAFFHPTFQEYFVACEIPHWDFFLPRDHVDRPVTDQDNPEKYKRYRIFEPQWKEVILLWLGRKDLLNQEKNKFIKELMDFEDGCGLPNFYGALGYFIAAAGTSEFLECSETMAIMDELIKFAFGEFDFERWEQTSYLEPLPLRSIEALQNMPHEKLVNKLIPIMDLNSWNNLPVKLAHLLRKSDYTNTELLISLINFFGETHNDELFNSSWLFTSFLGNRATKKIIAKVPAILQSLIENLIKKIFKEERSLRILAIKAFQDPFLKSTLPERYTLVPSVLEDFISGNLDNYLRLPVLAEIINQNPDILDTLFFLLEVWEYWVRKVQILNEPPSIERKDISSIKKLNEQEKSNFLQASEDAEQSGNIEEIEYVDIDNGNEIIEVEVMRIAIQLIDLLGDTEYKIKKDEEWLLDDNADHLIDILRNESYDSFPEYVVINTRNYDSTDLIFLVIKGLKDCLSEKTYHEDFIRFKYCYKIVWHCAQNMNYPSFYEVWHSQTTTTHP